MNDPIFNIPDLIAESLEGAYFSECRKYRYLLWRRFEGDCPIQRMCAFIGLNPSTADEINNDPTVTRCINYSKAWGFQGFIMLNLFAFRGTDPKDMKNAMSPVGPLNDRVISQVTAVVGRTVCAWGTHGLWCDRDRKVRDSILAKEVYHLGRNRDGTPKHPLYLRSNLQPLLWQGFART